MAASGPDSRARLDALIDDFRRVVRGPTRVARLLAAWLCGSLLLLVARGGTDAWRGLAAVGLSVLPILWIGLGLRSRRRWRGSSGVRRLLTPVDAALGARVLRARGLLERTRQDETAGSAELAELHASRTVDEIPTKLLDARAQSVRRKLRWSSLALAATLGALSSVGSLRLLEGASVLFAEAGVGRLRLAYFEEVEFIVEEPAYLASGEPRLVTGTAVVLPQGSSVTARIMPRSFVRDWVLDDGLSHAAFVSEGSGTWVAHLRIDQPTTLRVGARLGEVSVFASDELQVLTLEDRAPIVKLEDAPRTLSLEDMERLELSYAAFDDHGLAQIDLVLESGRRAERIELVHLDGKRRAQQGGYALERHHPFLKRAF
ncbi:MAG TPA: hypothetical protein VLC09_00695, partial [Polyangiaceae bacterium]|nr:hypothetical protein [Polyangiaceae bacterium]